MTKLEEVALSIWHERAKHFGEPPRPFVKDERTGREKNAIVPAGWIPICEKRFMYDMTLSLTLRPGEAELPADEVRRRSRQFAAGKDAHRCLAAVARDAGGQQQRQARHGGRYAPPRHARTSARMRP